MDDFEKQTRKVFHQIHKMQGENDSIFFRVVRQLTTDYLKVEKNFFEGKVCLDAGCGSNANATFSMLEMGAKKVYAIDLDESVLQVAPKRLKEFDGRYEINFGSILDLKYDDKYFDFTHCSGVLQHTKGFFQGIKELSRVTKVGGIIYLNTFGIGGLVRELTNFFREKYQRENGIFNYFIDNLSPEQIIDFIQWLISNMGKNGDEFGKKLDLNMLKELIDLDLVLTIKDRITAPSYYEISEGDIRRFLESNGFGNVTRLTRYPRLKNVRRFLAPLYSDFESQYARFFYGSGNIQIKAQKLK